MTLQKSVLTVGVALATGLVFAAIPEMEALNLRTNAWFSATRTAVSGGAWNSTLEAGETTGYFEVDSTAAEPLTFTVSEESETTNLFNEVTVGMLAAYVPQTVELATPSGAKVGFAIKKWLDSNSVLQTNYYWYAGSEWEKSSIEVSVDDGAVCKLTIQVDRRYEPNKVRFLLNGTDVCNGWKALTTSLGATASVDLIGSGEVTNLVGQTFSIVSENIEVNPGSGSATVKVSIPDEDMAEIRAAAGDKSVGTYLAENSGKTGLTRLDGEVLFGKTTLTDSDKAVVKGEPVEATSGNVRIAVDGLDVRSVGGATVKYELQGSSDGSSWETVVEPTNDTTALEFPQNTNHRFFRVITTVTYGN